MKLWTSSTTAFDFGLGRSVGEDRIGVNFGFFRLHAGRVRLELSYHAEDATAARVIGMAERQ